MSNQTELANGWMDGCEQWIYELINNGCRPYAITFMFHPLSGPIDQIQRQIRKAVEDRFYPSFIREFAHHPRAPSEQKRLPKLLLFPDRLVWKNRKASLRRVMINEELHYHGTLLIPPISRLKRCPIGLIAEKQGIFARGGICRIHIKDIYNVGGWVDYVLKTINKGRADEADIILLPRGPNEVTRKPVVVNAEDRAIKDIQSRLNVSEGVAIEIVTSMETGGRHASLSPIRS